MKKVKIGVIGCGAISDIYFKNFTKKFDIIEVAACSNRTMKKAEEKAEKYNIQKVYVTTEKLLEDPEIQIVVNLTGPEAHYPINMAALEAGKHVYCEKPLAITRKQGMELVEKSKQKNLMIGCAPDTFMGAGLQTSRKLIDEGAIGKPIAVNAVYVGAPSTSREVNKPNFYFKPGGGPLFDMGPYYITALVSLLGPVKKVMGSAHMPFKERIFSNKKSPEYDKKIKIETPTTTLGIMEFESGVPATIITTKDSVGYNPSIEIYGTEGILYISDPNFFGTSPFPLMGCSVHMKKGYFRKKKMPYTHKFLENSRGLGVADMAYALQSGMEHRASGELSYHVLDIMQGIYDSSNEGSAIELSSTCSRPKSLLEGRSRNLSIRDILA